MNDPSALTPASVHRGPTGRWVVRVDEMDLGEEADMAKAVSALCMHAIAQRMVLVVQLASGAGKRYLTVDSDGIVTPSSAPANLVIPGPGNIGLGQAETDEATSQQWVERFILDPTAGQYPAPDPELAPTQTQGPGKIRRRRYFSR